MVYATADGAAGDRLRVGMVGGGRNAFIGAVHRFAMRLDDRIALVAGALSADPENAAASAAEIGMAPERSYADWREMARAEAARSDGIEAVAIVTPNHLHAPIATAFLEAGIDVICDKPLATTLGRGRGAGGAGARRGGRKFLVTLNNTGYAMVRQAREMVAAGELGRLVAVHAAYIQDWLTAADRRRRGTSRPSGGPIRRGPGSRRCWPISGCMPSISPASSRGGRPRRWRPISSPRCRGGGSTTMRTCWCAGRAGARGTHRSRARLRPVTTTT